MIGYFRLREYSQTTPEHKLYKSTFIDLSMNLVET